MPADVNSNSLSTLISGNDFSARSEKINKNQLFSSNPSQSFDTQLDWEISQSQKPRIQSEPVDRRHDPRSDRSTSTVTARNTRESGNELPRRDTTTDNRDRANNARREVEQRQADRASNERVRDSQQTTHKETSSDAAESNVEQAAYDKSLQNKVLNEGEMEQAQVLEQASLEAQLIGVDLEGALEGSESADSVSTPDLSTAEEFIVNVGDGSVLAEEQRIDAELLKVSQLAHDIKAAINEDVATVIEGADAFSKIDDVSSLEARLKALLQEDKGATLEGVGNSDNTLEETIGAIPNENLAAVVDNVELEELIEDTGLTEVDVSILQQRMQEAGILNAEGKIDGTNLETAQRVVAQLINDRLVRANTLNQKAFTGEAGNASKDDLVTDGEPGDADIEGLLKVNEKLNSKATDQFAKNHLEDFKQPLKQGENLLQQKLESALGQIKGSLTEKGASETSSTASRSVSSTTPAFAAGLVKAGENTSNQAAATKPFTMTMQNHFSKQGWAPEVGQRLMMMVTQKIQVAEIRLDPPDLGPMEVKVKMQQEQANVVFNTPHTAVKDALEQAMPKLKELFEQNGLSLGDVDVQDNGLEQRQGEGEEGGESNMLASDEGVEESSDESAVVMESDRLVDYYA